MFSFVTFPMMVYFPVYIYNKLRSNRNYAKTLLPCKVETCPETKSFDIEFVYPERAYSEIQSNPIRLSEGLSELAPHCRSVDLLDQSNHNTVNIHMISKDFESYNLMRDLIHLNEDDKVCYLPILSQLD
jgi:hypothetical protein